jgi:hypothetical protein
MIYGIIQLLIIKKEEIKILIGIIHRLGIICVGSKKHLVLLMMVYFNNHKFGKIVEILKFIKHSKKDIKHI